MNPLGVFDRNPARAQTLFFCLQEVMEACVGENPARMLSACLLSAFVTLPGQVANMSQISARPSWMEH